MGEPLLRKRDFKAPQANPLSMPRDDIVAIQMLRWIAASVVVLGHSQKEMIKVAARSHHVMTFSHLVELGIGVDIFFVISGFLIFHVSRRHFAVAGYPANFLKRRFLRVVPLYWLMTLAMLLAVLLVPALLNHNVLNPTLTAMSFFLVAWPDSSGGVFPLLNSGWTLNLEFYFYLVFAVALQFRQRLAIALLAAWFTGTVILAQALSDPAWWLAFYAQPIVLEFVAGVLLSLAYATGMRLSFATSVTIAIAAVALHIGLRQWGHVTRVVENGLPAGLLFFALVFNKGLALRPSLARFIRLMGDASYALYLTSPFVINLTFEALTRSGVHKPDMLITASCVSSSAVAVLVFHFVELPITRFGRRLIYRPATRAPLRVAGEAATPDPVRGTSMSP